jgi:superfamily II DNA or RNA helicase
MLDEGVDLPDVDIAINAAAEKTQRQLIQRRGRVLRRGGEHTPVFHQFVVDDEVEYYSDLGSVEPQVTDPEPVVERTLPTKIGTVDVWDIYHSFKPEVLHRMVESGDITEQDLTGREWWLQTYLDTHEELLHKKLERDTN